MRGIFFFQAEDGIRDLVRSRGLGDVYKRQALARAFLKDAPILILDEAMSALDSGSEEMVNEALSKLVKLSLIHI